MKLLTVSVFGLFVYTQVCGSQQVGYVGKNITLPAAAQPSWTLEKIEWAIYSNNTWIATHRSIRTKTDHVARYGRRLHLDTSSGDLTIHNLSLDDAMEFSVDLTNDRGDREVKKVQLVVKQPLLKPSVTRHYWSTDRGCVAVLGCRSSVRDAVLSWDTTSFSGEHRTMKREEELFLFIVTTQMSNKFTCTSTRDKETASSVFEATCDGENTVTTVKPTDPATLPETPEPWIEPNWRERMGLYFLGGLISGVVLMAILYEFLKGPWRSSKAPV